MRKKKCRTLCLAGGMLGAFVLWTVALLFVDVQAVGPLGTSVGFAALNACVHRFTGIHMELYTLTDWLGLVPVGFAAGFALLGLRQWIARGHILKVDRSIRLLGVFYAAVMAAYMFFESFPVNYRPVLIDGRLEASYPSSTTLLVLCIMPTAMMQLNSRIGSRMFRRCASFVLAAFTVFMVIARLASGVHWFSDIVGSMLLSAGFVVAYRAETRY